MRAVLSAFLIADDNLYIFTKDNAVWSDFVFQVKIIKKMFGSYIFLSYFCVAQKRYCLIFPERIFFFNFDEKK